MQSCDKYYYNLWKYTTTTTNDLDKYPKFQFIASAYVQNPVLPTCV